MSGNGLGERFRVTTAGESHGPAELVIVEGCPPGLELAAEDLTVELDRRRPGQSRYTSPRAEPDAPEILSGVYEGCTTGTPIAILVRNVDARSRDYAGLAEVYRPGHADYTYDARFGVRDPRGGGRASARETVARVAGGAVAKKLLRVRLGVEVVGYVKQIGSIEANVPDPAVVTLEEVEASPLRCPDREASLRMEALIDEVRADRDSIGGVAEIVATGVPAGLGEPVFDKLKADLAKALFSLPAVMGVEVGSGFRAAVMRGSEHNDPFVKVDGDVRTRGNHHGGILGGISSGMPIVMRAAVKPTSSISRSQATLTMRGDETEIEVRGRHDPCLLPRFVPMGEAMVALVLADHWLRTLALGRGSS